MTLRNSVAPVAKVLKYMYAVASTHPGGLLFKSKCSTTLYIGCLLVHYTVMLIAGYWMNHCTLYIGIAL